MCYSVMRRSSKVRDSWVRCGVDVRKEKHSIQTIVSTSASSRVKVNVWGCFCYRGLGHLYIFSDNLKASCFAPILGQNLIQSARIHYAADPPELWWLLQDNDPKHESVLVRSWLHNHGIHVLDFPPYSPDLNPIEHLWKDMARRVEARPASTMEELQDVVAEEWERTPLDYLRTLAHSMPARCQAVIDAKGGHTTY